MTVGTVAYAAPEQLMGEPIDGRADQYALAATAYHLLTGSQLFPHSNPAVVISRHLNAPVPALADARPDLAALDPVLAVALAKDRDDRFASCTDFARALSDHASSLAAGASLDLTRPAPTPRTQPLAGMSRPTDHIQDAPPSCASNLDRHWCRSYSWNRCGDARCGARRPGQGRANISEPCTQTASPPSVPTKGTSHECRSTRHARTTRRHNRTPAANDHVADATSDHDAKDHPCGRVRRRVLVLVQPGRPVA